MFHIIVNATRVPPRPLGGLEALESLSTVLLGGSAAALWRPETWWPDMVACNTKKPHFGRLCAVLRHLLGALGRLWGVSGRLVGPK